MERFALPCNKFVPQSLRNEADGHSRLLKVAPEGSRLRGMTGCQIHLAIRFTCPPLRGAMCAKRAPLAFLLLPLHGGCRKVGNYV